VVCRDDDLARAFDDGGLALVDHSRLSRQGLDYGEPALDTAGSGGYRSSSQRASAWQRPGWATCARLAVELRREERALGEPRLRAAELEAQRPIACAQAGHLRDGPPGSVGRISCLFPDLACR